MQSDWSRPTVTVVIQNDPHINAFSMYSMYVKRSTLPCCEYWNDDHANVEANPSSPGWMDGMAVNVQSMVLLSTQLEKQDAKPSQRRRRIKIIEATEMAEIDFSLVWWKFCQLCHQRQAMVQLLFLLNVVVIIPVFPVYVVLHKP